MSIKEHTSYGLLGAIARGACALALSVSLVPAIPASALALTVDASSSALSGNTVGVSVSGMDFPYSGDEYVEFAEIGGLGENSLWSDIVVDNQVSAVDMSYKYDDPSDVIGVMSINIAGEKASDLSGRLSVNVYDAPSDARGGASPLASLSVYAIYADCGSESKLVGFRSATDASDATRPFEASRIIYGTDGRAWALDSAYAEVSPKLEGNALHIAYREISDDAVSGIIEYVSSDGTVVKTEEIPDIADGASVGILSQMTIDGISYRPVSASKTVWLSADFPRATVNVAPVSSPEAERAVVSLRYVGEDGEELMHERVLVGKEGVLYSPPSVFSQVRSGNVESWTLTGYDLGAGMNVAPADGLTLSLSPSSPDAITLRYAPTAATITYRVSIGIVHDDGQGGLVTEKVDTLSWTISENSVADVEVPLSLTENGETYGLVGSTSKWSWSMDDYVAGDSPYRSVWYADEKTVSTYSPYNININAVDIATGDVIMSKVSEVTLSSDALIDLADDITSGGVRYEKLPGQPARTHSFFDEGNTECVYYRAESDTRHAASETFRTDVVEMPATVTDVDNSAQEAGRWSEEESLYTVASNTPASTIEDGEGDDTATVMETTEPLSGSGATLLEEQLEDSPVPLSDYTGAQNGAADGENGVFPLTLGIPILSVAAVIIISAVIAIVYKRKQSKKVVNNG